MNINKDILKDRGTNPLPLALAVAMLMESTAVLAVINNPPLAPISIGVFSQRDFVSASGYAADDQVVIRVIHDQANFAAVLPSNNGGTTGENTVEWISPQSTDPLLPVGENGIVEVNHPGGACWLGKTPDIRPGDKVQIEIVGNVTNPTRVGRIDETIVRNITAKRPEAGATSDSVVVHGTAQTGFTALPSSPLPVGELEQRLIAGELFANNTPRLTAASGGGDGTLSYDAVDPISNPNGINWTATYSGLSLGDVANALAAESSGKWLGGTEITTYEIGTGVGPGPQGACSSTAPLEILPPPFGADSTPPSVPLGVSASSNGPNTVTINWSASTDSNVGNGVNDNPGVTSYGVYRISGGNSVAIAQVKNPDGIAPAPITFVDNNVPPGTYTYKVDAVDSLGNRSALSAASQSVDTLMQSALDVAFNEPPANGRALLAFPSRDFVSAEGYAADEKVEIEIIRNGFVISSVDNLTPVDGIVEVNHPGGGCWEGVTPELRAGDIVRATATNNGNVRSIDQIHVANVTAKMAELITPEGQLPATIKIHGTAQAADGNPISIAEIEQRLISSSANKFNVNNKRDLRAPRDGSLSYDSENNPAGINWTATYSLDDQHDVDLALSVESRILWRGHDPLLGNEVTLFENGLADPPGPAAPDCLAPIEQPDDIPPSKPNFTNITADINLNQFTLTWEKSTDNWEVAGYQIYDGGNLMAIVGPDVTSHVLSYSGSSQHTFTLRAFDNASPLGVGGDHVSRLTDGLGNPYGNLSEAAVCCSSSTPPVLVPDASLVPDTGLSFGSATLLSQTVSQVVTITNGGGAALMLTSINIAGDNPGDFIRTGGTCTDTSVISANDGNCTVEVAFKPTAGGARQANLIFDAANTTDLTVALTGTGIEPAAPPVPTGTVGTEPPIADAGLAVGNNGLVLALNKKLVNFGKVARNAKKELKIKVRNIGNAAVSPSFVLKGKGFRKVSTNCRNLAVNSSCEVVIRFKAPGKKGVVKGMLSVMANGNPNAVTAELKAATK